MANKKTNKVILHCALSFCILISAFYITAAGTAHAAELFFEAKNQELAQGNIFLVSIFLNTQGESVNAVEGKVFFPPQLLEIKDVRDGNSIINFWVERPKAEQTGTISFSGIIPGGYQATKGFIFSLVFQAKSTGNGEIGIRDAKVLLDTGEGTQASLEIYPFQFSISEGDLVQTIAEPVIDSEPPEEFRPEVIQSQYVFDDKWFLSFATQDKGSGISGYEVRESRSRILSNFSEWRSVGSPYVLEDQELRSYIYVKAVDKAGNDRIAVIAPRYPIEWYKQPLIWVIILGAAVLFMLGKILWGKSVKSR